MRTLLFVTTVALLVEPAFAQNKNRKAFLNADAAGPDFQIQGEYSGVLGEGDKAVKIGVQVIAEGDGKFKTVGYIGGLPGDGWKTETQKIPGHGEMDGDACVIHTDDENQKGHGRIENGVLSLFNAEGENVLDLKKVVRKSPTLGQKPPSGAVVLFDGTNADNWKPANKLSDDKLLMQGVTSKETFGSYKMHMEFRLSFMPWARGQGRSNSGFYNQGRYEVQILDSFGLEGKHNECGGIYTIEDPQVNMCFPPLSWQTYDIEYHAAKYDDDGKKTAHARMTVRHNGVIVHEDTELDHATTAHPVKEGPEPGPVFFQDHGNPVRFRNIWVQPIDE